MLYYLYIPGSVVVCFHAVCGSSVISSSLSLRTVFVMLSLQPPYTPLKLVSDDAFRAVQYTVGLHVGGKFYKMFQLESTNHDITHSHWKS